MNWNDLRYVLAIARAGTLSGAARRLRVDQTTVARRLAAADAALGARLFDRMGGLFHATEAGEVAIAQAEEVERAFDTLLHAVGGGDAEPSGTVRLTSVPIIVNRLLVPALPELLRRYPRLRIELIAESRDLNLTKREADIALRLARPRSGVALARRIGRLDYAVFAPRRAKTKTLPWITYAEDLAHLPPARWMEAAARAAEPPQLMVNDAEAILQAVRAGLGKSLLPWFLSRREPGLKQLDGPAPVLSRDIWLLVHPELRPLARIVAVIGWLEGLMSVCRVRA